MRKIFLKYPVLAIIEGALLIALGLVIAIVGGLKPANMASALSISIAVVLFIDAALCVFSAVTDTKKAFNVNLIIAAVLLALGVVFCLPEGQSIIPAFISIFVGVALLLIGAGCVIKVVYLCVKKNGRKRDVALNILVAVVCIALGVLSIIFKETAQIVSYIVFGTAICVLGTIEVIAAAGIIKEKKKHPEQSQIKKNKEIVEAKKVEETKKDEVVIIDSEVKEIPSEDKKE